MRGAPAPAQIRLNIDPRRRCGALDLDGLDPTRMHELDAAMHTQAVVDLADVGPPSS